MVNGDAVDVANVSLDPHDAGTLGQCDCAGEVSAALVPHTGADGHRSLGEVSGALVECRFADTAALHEPGIP